MRTPTVRFLDPSRSQPSTASRVNTNDHCLSPTRTTEECWTSSSGVAATRRARRTTRSTSAGDARSTTAFSNSALIARPPIARRSFRAQPEPKGIGRLPRYWRDQVVTLVRDLLQLGDVRGGPHLRKRQYRLYPDRRLPLSDQLADDCVDGRATDLTESVDRRDPDAVVGGPVARAVGEQQKRSGVALLGKCSNSSDLVGHPQGHVRLSRHQPQHLDFIVPESVSILRRHALRLEQQEIELHPNTGVPECVEVWPLAD